MGELESSYNTTTQYNQGYNNNASALQIRLETVQIMENLELFLRGSKIVVEQDKEGKISTKRVDMGVSKANDQGIQAILNFVGSIINPQVVQGNFPCDGQGISRMYDGYIEETHIELVEVIVNNCYNWDIHDDDIDLIINFIMKLVIPFMTRLIDNKERESYGQSLKHIEHGNTGDKKEGIKLLGGNN